MFQSWFCFLIGCIDQFHWLITLSNNFLYFGVDFVFNSKRGKKFPLQGKEIIVFLVGVFVQS